MQFNKLMDMIYKLYKMYYIQANKFSMPIEKNIKRKIIDARQRPSMLVYNYALKNCSSFYKKVLIWKFLSTFRSLWRECGSWANCVYWNHYKYYQLVLNHLIVCRLRRVWTLSLYNYLIHNFLELFAIRGRISTFTEAIYST